jgi:hypothetical protein
MKIEATQTKSSGDFEILGNLMRLTKLALAILAIGGWLAPSQSFMANAK